MKLNLFFLALGLCFVLTVARSVRKRDEDDFPEGFASSCPLQQEERSHIRCEEDGSFSPLQCSRDVCRCVNPETGAPVSESFEEGEYDCVTEMPPTSEDPCPAFDCLLACVEYVEVDGCRTCECADGPEDDRSESSETTGSGSGDESSDDSSDDTTGDTTGSEDSTSGGCSSCPNVRRLLKLGCTRGCIHFDEGCPACNSTCVSEGGEGEGEDECSIEEPCDENQVCLSAGPFGQHRCFALLAEGEVCGGSTGGDDDDEEDSDMSESSESSLSYTEDESSNGGQGRGRFRAKIGGASDRYAVGRTGDARVGCAEGLVCATVALDRKECRPENAEGPCVQARAGDSELSCDEDGYYNALQCRKVDNTTYTCYCVRRDGERIEGSEETVTDPDDGPDCEDLVYERCEYEVNGVEYSIRHGDDYLLNNCSRCQCENGEPAFCEALGDCSAFVGGGGGPQGCIVDGVELNHGDIFDEDCNMCGCRNGKITCTNRKCDDEEDDEGSCESCRQQPRSPVCAPDGHTYYSACYAINCVGHSPVDLRPGPCTSYDVCEDFSCPEGQLCIPTGGRYCFSSDGCDPDELRICVNIDELMCEDDGEEDEGPEEDGGDVEPGDGDIVRRKRRNTEDEEEDEGYVCGTNCLSYPSVCHLIQDTAGTEQVAYAGRCNRPSCRGGPVCGTDGVTYDNRCVLRSRSNVRIDYEGECDPDSASSSIDESCASVSIARRCFYNESNCRRLVSPEEGCCALCGGITFVALDFAGLSDYARVNPRVRTLDALLEVLVEDGFIPEEVTERCELEAQATSSGNIEISLSADDEDSEFCNQQSQELANNINDPVVAVPEVLQFASAAVVAPTQQLTEEEDGAPPLVVLSFLSLLVCLLFSTILL